MLTIDASSAVISVPSATTASVSHLRSCIHHFDPCRRPAVTSGADPRRVRRRRKITAGTRTLDTLLAVNGTLMRGLALNGNLLAVGAHFVREARTAPIYRLWSIGDRHPAMMRATTGGAAIAVEVWSVPAAGLATILRQEPPGLCIGQVQLDDGR